MHSCDKYQQMISASLDETLATDKHAELDQHMATCAECRAFLQSSLNARAVLSALPFQSPTGAPPTLSRQSWWKRSVSVPLPLAAAVIIIMALGWMVQFNSKNPPDSVATSIQTFEERGNEVIVLAPGSAVLVSSTTQ